MLRGWFGRCRASDFFGCAGPRMQAEGVRAVVDSRSIAVVGIVEVIAHIPRIYGEFRKLKKAIAKEKPDVAVLTDSPDFHFRLAGISEAAGRTGGISHRSAGMGVEGREGEDAAGERSRAFSVSSPSKRTFSRDTASPPLI